MKSPFKGQFRVTATFWQSGSYWSGGHHKGIDLVGVTSTTVYAPCDGSIVTAGWENAANPSQGFGKYVSMWDKNKKNKLYFAHLSEIYVRPGQILSSGQRIGIMGSTGNSTGPHLHFEIRVNGSRENLCNPADWMGIKNKVGTYITTGDEGNDDNMTDEQVYQALQRYLSTQSLPTWAEGEFAKAVAAGITDGSNPMDYIPRYQAAIMALRSSGKFLKK